MSIYMVSFSYGCIFFQQSEELPDVIEKADKKMYTDKSKIKKRITGI